MSGFNGNSTSEPKSNEDEDLSDWRGVKLTFTREAGKVCCAFAMIYILHFH